MVELSATHTALRAIEEQLARLERTARRIAVQAPLGDLPGDLLELRLAHHGVAANVKVVKTADEMLGSLLDILA
jgi:hypothetical protein